MDTVRVRAHESSDFRLKSTENQPKVLILQDFYGSGLYILSYEIDETFTLRVGGGAPIGKPIYVYLQVNNSANTRINLLESSEAAVKGFIEAHKDSVTDVSGED